MSEFDELTSKPETNIEGTYDCQWCPEKVYEAYYDPGKQVLLWWCTQGHQSMIEEFTLW